MDFSPDKFTTSIVSITVAVIVFSMVCVPILSNAIAGLNATTDAQLISILKVIPIFIVIGILLACIRSFVLKNKTE